MANVSGISKTIREYIQQLESEVYRLRRDNAKLQIENKELKEYKWMYEDLCK